MDVMSSQSAIVNHVNRREDQIHETVPSCEIGSIYIHNFDTEKLKNGDLGFLRYRYTFEQIGSNTYLDICYTQKDGFSVHSVFKLLELYIVGNLLPKDIVQHAQRAINIMIEVAKGAMS